MWRRGGSGTGPTRLKLRPREKLWAEAAGRERLLVETMADEEEQGQDSLEEVTKRHRVVFVTHSEEITGTLEALAAEKACLEKVVPGRGDYEPAGMNGSWLMSEKPE
jgi:hypothetical protein